MSFCRRLMERVSELQNLVEMAAIPMNNSSWWGKISERHGMEGMISIWAVHFQGSVKDINLLHQVHYIQGDFFNWPPPEFAKCWPVSN